MAYLFVYGTLMFPEIGSIFFGNSKGIKSILKNYHRFRIFEEDKFKVYPAIDQRINSQVEGLVYRVNEEQINNLDEYEGSEYDRIETSIDLKDSTQKVWVYVWNHSSNAQLLGEWKAEKIDRAMLRQFFFDEFD